MMNMRSWFLGWTHQGNLGLLCCIWWCGFSGFLLIWTGWGLVFGNSSVWMVFVTWVFLFSLLFHMGRCWVWGIVEIGDLLMAFWCCFSFLFLFLWILFWMVQYWLMGLLKNWSWIGFLLLHVLFLFTFFFCWFEVWRGWVLEILAFGGFSQRLVLFALHWGSVGWFFVIVFFGIQLIRILVWCLLLKFFSYRLFYDMDLFLIALVFVDFPGLP